MWEWFTELGDDIWEGVESVGDFFTGTEGVDIPFTNDMLAPVAIAGSQLIGPKTEGGNFYDGSNLTGMLSNFIGNDVSPWIDLGKTVYGGYRGSQEADRYMENLAPLREIGNQYEGFMSQYYDPQNLARLENQEIARMTEQAAPLLDRATYRGAAAGAKAGQPWGASTVGNYNQAQNQRDTARLFSDVIQPRARQNVYDTGTAQSNAYTSRAKMMSGQPQFQPTYQQAQYRSNPWTNAADNYFNRG